MNLNQGILASIFFIGFSIMSFYSTKKWNISRWRIQFLGFFGIIISVLAINAILLIVAPRVPHHLKDVHLVGLGVF